MLRRWEKHGRRLINDGYPFIAPYFVSSGQVVPFPQFVD